MKHHRQLTSISWMREGSRHIVRWNTITQVIPRHVGPTSVHPSGRVCDAEKRGKSTSRAWKTCKKLGRPIHCCRGHSPRITILHTHTHTWSYSCETSLFHKTVRPCSTLVSTMHNFGIQNTKLNKKQTTKLTYMKFTMLCVFQMMGCALQIPGLSLVLWSYEEGSGYVPFKEFGPSWRKKMNLVRWEEKRYYYLKIKCS